MIIATCHGDVLQSLWDTLALPPADPSLLAAVECTAVNQLAIVPVVYYPLFFSITGAVQGSPMSSRSRGRARASST